MKITAIRTQTIEIPFEKPIGTSIHNITGGCRIISMGAN